MRRLMLVAAMLVGCAGTGPADATDSSTQSPPTTVAEAAPADVASDASVAEDAPVDEAGSDATDDADSTEGDAFPSVIDATAQPDGDGTWRVSATLSSPYDTPERYADAWRVLGPDGTEYGIRVLTHDHANEQPFTRSQSAIPIPDDVETVTIQGRDLANGWGGPTFDLDLDRGDG